MKALSYIIVTMLFTPILAQSQIDTVNLNKLNECAPDPALWWFDTSNKKAFFSDLELIGIDDRLYKMLSGDSSYFTPIDFNSDTSFNLYRGFDVIDVDSFKTILNDSMRSFQQNLTKYSQYSVLYNISLLRTLLALIVYKSRLLMLGGTEKWVYKENGRFMEWSLNDSFYSAKYHLQKAKPNYDELLRKVNELKSAFSKLNNMRVLKYSDSTTYAVMESAIGILESYDSLSVILDAIEQEVNKSSEKLGPLVILTKRLEDVKIGINFTTVNLPKPPNSVISFYMAVQYRKKPFVLIPKRMMRIKSK